MLLMSLSFAGVVAADQLAKRVIATRLPEGASTAGIVGGIRFRHVVNRRKQWGSQDAVRVMTVIWILLGAVSLTIASFVVSPSTQIALGGIMGGATGNLLDGLRKNGVTDFIDLRVWPVFNVADAAIVAAVALLLWNGFRATMPG